MSYLNQLSRMIATHFFYAHGFSGDFPDLPELHLGIPELCLYLVSGKSKILKTHTAVCSESHRTGVTSFNFSVSKQEIPAWILSAYSNLHLRKQSTIGKLLCGKHTTMFNSSVPLTLIP